MASYKKKWRLKIYIFWGRMYCNQLIVDISEKHSVSIFRISFICCLLYISFLLPYFLNLKMDVICSYETAFYPRRQNSSEPLLWELKILNNKGCLSNMNNADGWSMTTPPPHMQLLAQAAEVSLKCGKTCCNNFIIISEELVTHVITFI
jgi:hypothetical protein